MKSDIFSIDFRDIGTALLVGVVGALFLNFYQQWGNCALAIDCYDFVGMIEAGISFGLAYIGTTFFSDDEGKLGGAF